MELLTIINEFLFPKYHFCKCHLQHINDEFKKLEEAYSQFNKTTKHFDKTVENITMEKSHV